MKILISLIVTILLFCACLTPTDSKVVNNQPQIDSSLFVVAVSDYYTLNLEKVALYKFAPSYSTIDSCPIVETIVQPADFGSTTFKTTFSNDTIFHGTTIWMGRGEIVKPTNLELFSPDSLKLVSNVFNNPLKVKLIKVETLSDTNISYACIDSLRATGLPMLFKNGRYTSLVYLYSPVKGPTNYNYSKWITISFGEENQ